MTLADEIARAAVDVARLQLAGNSFETLWLSDSVTAWRLRIDRRNSRWDTALRYARDLLRERVKRERLAALKSSLVGLEDRLTPSPNSPATGGRMAKSGGSEPASAVAACICHRCIQEQAIKGPGGLPLSSTQMIVCPTCGNKRCPKANDHRMACTGSNDPGQPGTVYGPGLTMPPLW